MWNIKKNIIHSFLKNYGGRKMQLDNNGFNIFKMNDSTRVQILIVQKVWGLYKLLDVFY
jgi:hypothetical protein